MIHELKILHKYYVDIERGNKRFEIRKNDRNYMEGDYLALNEIDDEGCKYTGRAMIVKVSYVFEGSSYCKDGYVILGIDIPENGYIASEHSSISRNLGVSNKWKQVANILGVGWEQPFTVIDRQGIELSGSFKLGNGGLTYEDRGRQYCCYDNVKTLADLLFDKYTIKLK